MTRQLDWVEDAFFETPPADSLDGGTTDHGALWHGISPRWGHSMHTMCSYHGMFPARLVHFFLNRFSRRGDLILDPFSGRGTVALQARVEGRRTISNDLNPLAYVLTRAKANPPEWTQAMDFLSRLERDYRARAPTDPKVPPDIQMLFHGNTLRQLMFLRNHLLEIPMSSWSRTEFLLAGATAGILHGNHRSDGTSRYLSISMPNTFSMAPSYVRNYIHDHGLTAPDQDVFDCLRDKIARLYLDSIAGFPGRVMNVDACRLLEGRSIKPATIDLVITSPPYLNVVNYGTSNWIRLWWLGLDEVGRHAGAGRRSLNAKLDHQHNYDSYRNFMLAIFRGVRRVLKHKGIAVFVIGDVASPGGESLALARQLWTDIGDETGLRLVEFIEDALPLQSKVSRIWGETKGRATDRDCVLVVGRDDNSWVSDLTDIDWAEPYKDGGPDIAHARLRMRRR